MKDEVLLLEHLLGMGAVLVARLVQGALFPATVRVRQSLPPRAKDQLAGAVLRITRANPAVRGKAGQARLGLLRRKAGRYTQARAPRLKSFALSPPFTF